MADTVGSTSSGQDDSEDDQPNNGQHLDGTEPELGLSIDTRSLLIEEYEESVRGVLGRFRASTHEEVDEEDHSHADSDPDGVVDFGRVHPVVDKDSTGCQFSG
jgi:hypothetical protein